MADAVRWSIRRTPVRHYKWEWLDTLVTGLDAGESLHLEPAEDMSQGHLLFSARRVLKRMNLTAKDGWHVCMSGDSNVIIWRARSPVRRATRIMGTTGVVPVSGSTSQHKEAGTANIG